MSFAKRDINASKNDDDNRIAKARLAVSGLENQVDSYRRDLHQSYAEIDRLTKERDHARNVAVEFGQASVELLRVTRTRETIDGVDCERIRGLDVIVPVGLIPDGEEPAEVRSYQLPCDARWIDNLCGVAEPSKEVEGEPWKGDLYLTLADNPAPATTPTWTPPDGFGDGEYCSLSDTLVFPSGDWVTHKALGWLYPGGYDTARTGRWRVASGKATYLGPVE